MNVLVPSGPIKAGNVLACAMLQILDPELQIDFSSEEAISLAYKGIVINQGLMYRKHGVDSPGRYDYQQVGGAGERDNGKGYASAGLVWLDFGDAVLRACWDKHIDDPSKVNLTNWRTFIDDEFISMVDVIDLVNPPLLSTFTFAGILEAYNPIQALNEFENYEDCFRRALAWCVTYFKRVLMMFLAFYKAQVAIKDGRLVDDGDILIIDTAVPTTDQQVPRATARGARFVISPMFSNWVVTSSVDHRANPVVTFPDEWHGLTGQVLQDVCHVKEALLCSPEGTMMITKTQIAAIELCRLVDEKVGDSFANAPG